MLRRSSTHSFGPLALSFLAAVLPACGSRADEADTALAEPGHPADDEPTSPAPSLDERVDAPSPDSRSGPNDTTPDEPPDDFVIEDDDEGLARAGEPIACEREIEFEAVVLSDPAPFDVIIVADHSMSLGWSKNDLSAGLSQLLANVSGRSARFFVLTPTQYGASAEPTSRLQTDDMVSWRDPITSEPYQNEVTRYSEVCTDGDDAIIECPAEPRTLEQNFTIHGQFEFVMPEPVAAITQDMSEEQIQAQQDVIKSAILALGGSGASYEQPLCTLARYVSQAPESLPERAVFVVLSDEDDKTDPRECLAGFEYTKRQNPAEVADCSAGCDYVRFWAFAPASRYWVSYTCVPTDDLGTPFPDQAKDGAFTYTTPDGGCQAPTSDCSEENLDSVRRYCTPGAVIESCARTCGNDPEDRVACMLEVEIDADYCAGPFEYGGRSFQNMADYCQQRHDTGGWDTCEPRRYSSRVGSGSWGGSFIPKRVAPGALESSQLADYFRRQAESLFGANDYFVELIVFEPRFACEPESGQSHAENLLGIVSSQDDVFPICESYAPALERVGGFAQQALQTEYTFELSARETLEAIVVTDIAGRERRLGPHEYQYDFSTSRLSLAPGAITARDRKLTVEVAIHCSTVVR